MQQSLVIALFLGTATTINLGFSDMPEGDYNMDASFVQVTSRAAASTSSGVRAKWVELPDCRHWCNHLDDDGKPADPPADGAPAAKLYIPLRDDLANAIIATCKGAEPAFGAEACPVNEPEVYDDSIAHPATKIYDPVWKTTTVIPDQEHQVEYNGVANTTHASSAIDGPKGDFYAHWNWEHQSKGAEWNADDGAYGENYTELMPTEIAIGSHPYDADHVKYNTAP
jgi:hypothetical protein